MRVRILVIAGTFFLSLGLVGMALMPASRAGAAQPAPNAESLLEAELAAAAEANARTTLHGPVAITAPSVVTAPLFVGVDNVSEFAYLVDPDTSESSALFDDHEIWGAAYDPDNERVLFVEGVSLYEWSTDGVLKFMGDVTSANTGNSMAMVGLAYGDGVLYALRNITTPQNPEGLYEINLNTQVATLVTTFSPGPDLYDIGGLAFDPVSDKLYGTNDIPDSRGLVEIGLNGVITAVAPYPAGQNDLDGLAIGDGRAYLVPDEPGFIYVYDFATMTYTTPITNPWTTSEVFSGAAWIQMPKPSYFPAVFGSSLAEPSR